MTEKIYLQFDQESVTFDQMIALQEADGKSLREQKALLTGFVVDETGAPLDAAAAETLLGKMTVRQMRETFAAFKAQIEEVMGETLPNGPGPS